MLAAVREEEERERKGKLKIFFGAAPGVGKTFAMLKAARSLREEAVDVVVGWVETHGRAETEALLDADPPLPRLPAIEVEHRGRTLRDLDLEAALKRRPALLVVDELAHTNAPGLRHPKRWQDVLDLLDAGIDVHTTVNVQHLESLNDVVAQVTGVVVRETVPDSMIERADEIELIDLPPDDLLERLREGKVYLSEQIERAAGSFFRKGNLIALRELALRRTAERVDGQMRGYMRAHGIQETWAVAERIVVCVGPSPMSARLIRATRRMAGSLKAEWHAVYVQTPAQARLSEADRGRVDRNLALAERLGASTVQLHGAEVAGEVLRYARRHNVSKIVVGKPTHPRWKDFVYGSLLDDLVRQSGDIDVYVIQGTAEARQPEPGPPERRPARPLAYAWSACVAALCTLAAWLMHPFSDLANLIMVYLLGVVFVASRFGAGPSVLASVLGVAAFDFFFVRPYLTLAVGDLRYLVTFAIMLGVGLVIASLTARIRRQAESAGEREQRTAALYAMSRELAVLRGIDKLSVAAARHVRDVFAADAVVLRPGPEGRLAVCGGTAEDLVATEQERAVAEWAYAHGKAAGAGTDTLPSAGAMHLPLQGSSGPIGVLSVRPRTPSLLDLSRRELLDAFATQTALALERALLARQAQRDRLHAQAEELRNALLSSVSHDLRTPLATITGAAGALLDEGEALDPAARRDLMQTVLEEAQRLERLVRNLLDMTRLESGALAVKKEWLPLEEVVGAALNRVEEHLEGREVSIDLGRATGLVPMDGVLIEQVLINLLENALKYSPAGSPIAIRGFIEGSAAMLEIKDRGQGIAPGEEEVIFEKFYRGRGNGRQGLGLGLTICRGVVAAHGGRITAENRPDGGAMFRVTLPIEGRPPHLASPELPAGAGA
ncbi:sensor protein KdpD [Sorangium cellulosum]|uniref:histidine kinase n=1 Tax=Sorangium cellulosum TaxID=56 RepID=A0A150R6Q9_SORCE|nr:sensor protein KdpD [Sorangium cellulosum]